MNNNIPRLALITPTLHTLVNLDENQLHDPLYTIIRLCRYTELLKPYWTLGDTQSVTRYTENKFASKELVCGVLYVLENARRVILKIKSSEVVPKLRMMENDN